MTSPKMVRPFPWWNRLWQKIWSQTAAAWKRGDMIAYEALGEKARRIYGKAFEDHKDLIKRKLMESTNQKKWWQMTRDIAGLGRKKQSKTPRAEALATSFTEKFQIPGEESAVVPHLENEDFTTELKTFRVKRNQIQQVHARLDESKSVGLDGVSSRVLKQCATVLSMPLT